MDAIALGVIGLAVGLTGFAAFSFPEKYVMPGRVLAVTSVIVAAASGAYGYRLQRTLGLARIDSGDEAAVEVLAQQVELVLPYLEWTLTGAALYGGYAFLFTFTKVLFVPDTSTHRD